MTSRDRQRRGFKGGGRWGEKDLELEDARPLHFFDRPRDAWGLGSEGAIAVWAAVRGLPEYSTALYSRYSTSYTILRQLT